MKIAVSMTFSLIFLSLISCVDYSYNYTYKVTNLSGSGIKIDLKTTEGIDSTYSIDNNEIRILFITNHGLEGPDGPHFTDVSTDLEELIITKNEIVSKKNYLDNLSWEFSDGTYHSIVTNEEFK